MVKNHYAPFSSCISSATHYTGTDLIYFVEAVVDGKFGRHCEDGVSVTLPHNHQSDSTYLGNGHLKSENWNLNGGCWVMLTTLNTGTVGLNY